MADNRVLGRWVWPEKNGVALYQNVLRWYDGTEEPIEKFTGTAPPEILSELRTAVLQIRQRGRRQGKSDTYVDTRAHTVTYYETIGLPHEVFREWTWNQKRLTADQGVLAYENHRIPYQDFLDGIAPPFPTFVVKLALDFLLQGRRQRLPRNVGAKFSEFSEERPDPSSAAGADRRNHQVRESACDAAAIDIAYTHHADVPGGGGGPELRSGQKTQRPARVHHRGRARRPPAKTLHQLSGPQVGHRRRKGDGAVRGRSVQEIRPGARRAGQKLSAVL
jgi:hypothetical protein